MKTLMNFQVCLQGEHSESFIVVDGVIVFVVVIVVISVVIVVVIVVAIIVFFIIVFVIVVVIVVFVIVCAISRWLIIFHCFDFCDSCASIGLTIFI